MPPEDNLVREGLAYSEAQIRVRDAKTLIGYDGFIMHISINLFLGVLAIAYGLYCFIQRKVAPEKIKKLQSLIERNGEEMGHSIHLFGHTLVPIAAGLLLVFAHFRV